MALITRVTRLFRADVHAVLDRIEEPDLLLKQSIREMEEAQASSERQLKLMQHELAQLARRETELEQSLSNVDDELDLCFESHKEQLAHSLVRRKLEMEQQQRTVVARRETLEQQIAERQQRVEENRRELESMQQKAALLSEEPTADTTVLAPWSATERGVSDEDVEVAFLREQQRRARS